MYEIRWHGRGGQGAVTASYVLVDAAYRDGYEGVQSFPFFGAERRGAPVKAFTRISKTMIYSRCQIYEPDAIIVLDPTLLDIVDVTEGLKRGGVIVANANEVPKKWRNKNWKIYIVDATAIALEVGLIVAGSPVLNTPMLGAFAKATGLVRLERIKEAISNKWKGKAGERNIKAAELAYEQCKLVVS
ncbi:MAG: 2-oxoacid:acceptor oxidoreductase family protein [Promethearchaeota archaeon]